MTHGRRFGEVADDYDDVRPEFAPGIAEAIARYHASAPEPILATALEVGAGTGKGTAVLRHLRARLTCLEPDERMAAVLRRRYPDVTVLVAAFEDPRPAAPPVDLLGCAMAWHWLDPGTRNRRAFDALRPGGTLAIFGHRYAYADKKQAAAINAAFASVEPAPADPPTRADSWHHDDVAASALFEDVRTVSLHRWEEFHPQRYLRLVQTFAPFRAKPPHEQARTLAALAAAVAGFPRPVVVDLPTTITLARRPRT